MAKYQRWTEEEDKVLLKALQNNLHNREKAFKEAASQLDGRSISSCSNRWYITLSNPKHPKYVGSLFVMIGKQTNLNNRIIVRKDTKINSTSNKKRIWNKIKSIIGLK